MKASTLFLIFLLPCILSIEIPIVDDDYVMIPIGADKKELKLLIDPVGHLTYIINPLNTTTKIVHNEKYTFENHFGKFDGHYETDFIFPTKDKIFGFPLKYLMVDNADTELEADGVIGLGYSDEFPDETNIYKILSKMKSIMSFKKVMTYDKKNKKLVIGSVPDFDSFNPVAFDIEPNEDYPFNLVNLTQIGFLDKKGTHYVNIAQKAKFGLLPTIIAPPSAEKKLKEEIIPYLTENPKDVKIEMNKRKLYKDIFFGKANANTKAKAVMAFGIPAYKFEHTWKDKDGKMSAAIRIGSEDNLGDYWYIGIDKLNINRADFDYEKMKVTMYSPSAFEIGKIRLPYLIFALLSTITFITVLAIFIRLFCAKKKQVDIREGEELLFL